MKIAFDENVPLEMVRVFRKDAETTLSLGHLVVSARDYRPDGEHGDENWLRRFAADGGEVVISGDARMRSLAHERAALADCGLITYFFVSQWNTQDFHTKSAMLVKWFPRIAEHMATAPKGSCWEMPFTWHTGEFRDVSARSTEIMPTRPKPKRRKRKKKPDAKEKTIRT